MTINPNFADWYRSAALTPPEGLLDKRWGGVEDAAKHSNADSLVSLAQLFALPNATESSFPAELREIFRNHDDGFPSRDNLQELRILAGAILHVVIDQRQDLSPLAALAVICGAFGPRETASLEEQHIDRAQRFIVEYSLETRKSVTSSQIKIPSFTKAKFGETLQQPHFVANQIQNAHDPLLTALAEISTGFSASLKQVQKAIDQLSHSATVREEEVAILWWLQTHFSRDLQRPFSEIGYASGTFVFAMELADLVALVPGPETSVAVLVHALQLAGSPSSNETVTIANATNSTPRNWREKIRTAHALEQFVGLTPMLLAIHKSLETDGRDEWLPVYRKACDIPVDRPFPLIQIALQLFRERMLLRAFSEAKP